MIVVFLNTKGGCGKSTSTVHLCRYLLKRKKQVALIDADSQQTSIDWVRGFRAEIPQPECRRATQPKALHTQICDCLNRYDATVIDSPPGLGRVQRIALLFADIVMVPVQPGIPDLRATAKLLEAIRAARRARQHFEPRPNLPAIGAPDFQAFTFLVRTVSNTRLADKARSLLREREDARFLEADIPQRQAIADAMELGATAFDINTKAARQVADAYRRLFESVGL